MKHFFTLGAVAFSSLFLPLNANAIMSFKDQVSGSTGGYRWTGFYIGLNLGAVNHTANITDSSGASFLATIQQVTNPRLTGGIQTGYRIQVIPYPISGVYGIEFSANFANASFKKEYGSPFSFYQFSSEHTLNTILLLEATGGIAVDQTLLFLAAGLAWVNITGSTTNLDSIAFFDSYNVGKKIFAPAMGAGIEYSINDKCSVRFKFDVIMPNTYSTTDSFGNSYQISNNIMQGTLGINYKIA